MWGVSEGEGREEEEGLNLKTKYKSFQELYANRPNNLPFVVSEIEEEKNYWAVEVVPVDNNSCTMRWLREKSINARIYTLDEITWSGAVLVDWFEDEVGAQRFVSHAAGVDQWVRDAMDLLKQGAGT